MEYGFGYFIGFRDRIWLWVYYKISIYLIFYLPKGDYAPFREPHAGNPKNSRSVVGKYLSGALYSYYIQGFSHLGFPNRFRERNSEWEVLFMVRIEGM